MTQLTDCVQHANELLQQAATLEVMERYYADDVSMQENETPPRQGKAFCMEHERQNMAKVKDLKIAIVNQAIDEVKGTVFTELDIHFTLPTGQVMNLKEVSVQQWKAGKIQQEKFYYKALLPVQ